MITFCFYDKRYKHSFLPSDRNCSQWRFEITIHPQQMNAFFQDQPTSEFFLFVQHFVVLFRACDKQYKNHGVNMVLKALKIALKPYQKQNTYANTKSAKNTQNNKSKENKKNTNTSTNINISTYTNTKYRIQNTSLDLRWIFLNNIFLLFYTYTI